MLTLTRILTLTLPFQIGVQILIVQKNSRVVLYALFPNRLYTGVRLSFGFVGGGRGGRRREERRRGGEEGEGRGGLVDKKAQAKTRPSSMTTFVRVLLDGASNMASRSIFSMITRKPRAPVFFCFQKKKKKDCDFFSAPCSRFCLFLSRLDLPSGFRLLGSVVSAPATRRDETKTRQDKTKHDTTRHDTTRQDKIFSASDPMKRHTAQHDTTQHDTTLHDTTRHGTTHHNTAQHNTTHDYNRQQ
jgi:hypothetical protein